MAHAAAQLEQARQGLGEAAALIGAQDTALEGLRRACGSLDPDKPA